MFTAECIHSIKERRKKQATKKLLFTILSQHQSTIREKSIMTNCLSGISIRKCSQRAWRETMHHLQRV